MCLPIPGPTAATHPAPFFAPRNDWPRVLVHDAVELWTLGHPVAAGMMARAALESHLRGIARSKSDVLRGITGKLCRLGMIDLPTMHRLNQLLRIGHRAAHGRPVTFEALERLVHGAYGCLLRQGGCRL